MTIIILIIVAFVLALLGFNTYKRISDQLPQREQWSLAAGFILMILASQVLGIVYRLVYP